MPDDKAKTVELTADIVAAYVEANSISVTDLPNFIRAVHDALTTLETTLKNTSTEEPVKVTPTQIRKSITTNALISFIDGKPYKTLKRHLTTHGLTVEDYKAKFGLPADYPTVAPSYSQARSAMAKALGLGQGGRKAKGAKMRAKQA